MKCTKIDNNTLKATFNVSDIKLLSEDKDKFLVNAGKTVGFRKDKKLEKFVGLRDGYSKQLELSLLSVLIDGNEIITDTKFKQIKSVNNVILQKINNIEFYNRVDSTNYKNLVKVENKCENVEIKYRVDLKGMKVYNKSYISNDVTKYLENDYKQFLIADEGNDNKMFVINKPIVFDENNKQIDIVEHELYLENDILYYKKNVNMISYYIDNKIFNLPIYIDANIEFGDNIYYSIKKSINELYLTTESLTGSTNWINFLDESDNGFLVKDTTTTNILDVTSVSTDGNYKVAHDFSLSRFLFSFDLSELSNYGNVNITNAYFNFFYSEYELDNPFILQKMTYNGNSFDITNWNKYGDTKYYNDSNEYRITKTDRLRIINEDTSEIDLNVGINNFMLRIDYDYDKTILPYTEPISIDLFGDFIKYSTLEIDFEVSLYETKTLPFNIVSGNSFGVLNSTATTYNDAFNGTISVNNVHNSTSGTYKNAFGLEVLNNEIFNMYRTYFSFDISMLDSYVDNVIRDVRFKFVGYENRSKSVSVYYKKSNTLIDELSWNLMESGYTYLNNYDVNYIGNDTTIRISSELLSDKKYLEFILIDYNSDYLKNSSIVYTTGIDFSNTILEVDLEPYLISGIQSKKILKGDIFELSASMNVDNANFEIRWFSDYELNNLIYVGDVFNGLTDGGVDSNYYNDGDIIYAAIFDNTTDEKVSVNTLAITLTIYENEFDVPYINKKGIYDVGDDDSGINDLHVVNLDNVYFKYINGVDGICYSYARDLNNIYENNPNVSDGTDIGSYNMYNEFDIIDEFQSNMKNVDIAIRFDSIDLTKSYRELDGIIIHEGTRILLYSDTPNENDGVYVANYNLKLIKSDETNDVESRFRYKVNVNYGTFLDYEFHTFYYDNDSDIYDDTENEFKFEVFDSSLYGDVIFDFGTYYDRIYDSNA